MKIDKVINISNLIDIFVILRRPPSPSIAFRASAGESVGNRAGGKMRRAVPKILTFLISALCISLISMPASAASYTLGIFGNANMDGTIDEEDIEYLKGIITGENEPTELADANYDGKIDEDDISQTELIIRGEADELTLLQYIGYPEELTEEPVTIPMPIERIAAIGGTYGPETLCAFGEEDRIVGVLQSAKERRELEPFLKDKPAVGTSTFTWDLEKILEQDPDIVLAYAFRYFPEYDDQLQASGIPLVQMDFYQPEKYSQEIRNLGWILGDQERAEELIEFEQQHLDLIKERTGELEKRPKVYAEWYADYQAVGPDNANNDAITIGGGVNIFQDATTKYPEIDSETVIVRNPQVIIKCSNSLDLFGYGVKDAGPLEELKGEMVNRPGWENIDAISNDRVYIISTYSHSIHPSVYYSYFAKCIHPELFEDIDPDEIYREWLQKFLGVEFAGLYAYPPPSSW